MTTKSHIFGSSPNSILELFIQSQKKGQYNASVVEKHVVQLAKLHHEMSRDHPAGFALLPNSIELVRAYWSLVQHFGESFGSKEAVTSALASASIGTDGDVDEDKPGMGEVGIERLANHPRLLEDGSQRHTDFQVSYSG